MQKNIPKETVLAILFLDLVCIIILLCSNQYSSQHAPVGYWWLLVQLNRRLHILSTLKTLKVATVLTGSLPGAANLWPPICLFSLVEVQSPEIEICCVFQWGKNAPKQLWNAVLANSNSPKIVYCSLGSSESPEKEIAWMEGSWLPLRNSSISTFFLQHWSVLGLLFVRDEWATSRCGLLLLTECSHQVV